MNRRVLLIEPPFYRLFKDSYSLSKYPLSLGYLAQSVLKHLDWEVCTYNADFNPNAEPVEIAYLTGTGYQRYLAELKHQAGRVWSQITDVIADFAPDVVGISCKSQAYRSACLVARLAKQVNKDALVILGGPHPSMVGREAVSSADVDLAVVGEGEETLVELLHCVGSRGQLADIPGIIYRDQGIIRTTAARPPVHCLDGLGFPHAEASRVLKNFSSYPTHAFSTLMATRGCPFACLFCGSRYIWGRKVRYRSPAHVVGEIQALQKLGLDTVHFDDDTFGVTKTYISKLCHVLRTECPGVRWSCELHVNLVHDDIIAELAQAGCYYIQLGVESGNNEILRQIRKGFTIEKARRAANTIKRHGLILQAFFMVGFPDETEESLRDTMDAIATINADTISYSIFTPYPGTEAFDICRQYGLIDSAYDVSRFNHQSPENCFCRNIHRDRFRQLVAGLETTIDEHNRKSGAAVELVRRRIRAINEYLPGRTRARVFGTGALAERVEEMLDPSKWEIVGYFDNDRNKTGTLRRGVLIETPAHQDGIKVIIASSWKSEIRRQLLELGYRDVDIITI
jgi:radical SAM superfamily enzyme YgiQ (UPF0313 family)